MAVLAYLIGFMILFVLDGHLLKRVELSCLF